MIIKQFSIIFLLSLFSLSNGKVNHQSKSSLIEQKQQQIENNQKALIPSPSPTPPSSTKSTQSILENDDIYRHTIIRETIYVPASNPTLISSSSSSTTNKKDSSFSSSNSQTHAQSIKEQVEPAHIINTLKSIYYILSHPIKLSSSIIPFISYQFYNLIYYLFYSLYLLLLHTIFYPSYYILNIISKPFILIYNILTSPLIITAISAILIGSLLGSLIGLLTGESTKSLILESLNLSLVTLNKVKKVSDWLIGSSKKDDVASRFTGKGRSLLEAGRSSRIEKIDLKGKGKATSMEPPNNSWYEENRRAITDSSSTSNSKSDSWEDFSQEGDDGDETEDTIRGGGYRNSSTGGIMLRREGMFQ